MDNPVVLPTSTVTVNKETIARHLLSDGTDPFNRSELTLDMVRPDLEMKAKIEAWKASRVAEKGVEGDAAAATAAAAAPTVAAPPLPPPPPPPGMDTAALELAAAALATSEDSELAAALAMSMEEMAGP